MKLLQGLENIAKGFGLEVGGILLGLLKPLSHQLSRQHDIVFKPNADYADLKQLLASSKIGLHTMTDEHFGISIIEYMVRFAFLLEARLFLLNLYRCQAAGVVVLAHDSGGPKSDIVVPFEGKPTGAVTNKQPSVSSRSTRN
jgi:alpha-1,2-mannosyltransferase